MVFNSVSELTKHIEKMMSQANREIAHDMVLIMKQEVQQQVYLCYQPLDYSRTRSLAESPTVGYVDKHLVEVEFMNNGDWKSHAYGMSTYKGGGSPFFALEGLESGATWGRNSEVNLMEGSFNRIVREIPKVYKSELKGLGVPIV